ncbi:MAG: hypothetical protein AAFO95_07860 [Cyanobacteria bacterium J06600_6]
MARNTKHASITQDEQKYLRHAIISRYCLNTKEPTFDYQGGYTTLNPLFDDIIDSLSIDRSTVGKNPTNNNRSFINENTNIALSLRVLHDFFHVDRSGRISEHTLRTIYAYVTKNKLEQEGFLNEVEHFYITITDIERKRLANKLWERFRSLVETGKYENRYEGLYSIILDNIDRDRPDCSIDKDVIISILDIRKDFNPKIAHTILNTLFLALSGGAHTRQEYLAQYDKSFLTVSPEFTELEIKSNAKKSTWYKSPEIPLLGIVFSIIAFIAFFSIRDNLAIERVESFLITLLSVILISSFASFYILYRQAKEDMILNIKGVNPFWLWWIKETPKSRISNLDKNVSVLIIHDNSSEVLDEVQLIKENFHIVNVIEFLSTKDNEEELKNLLWKNNFDGLYFLLTHDLCTWALKSIDEWAYKHEDVPVVYVNYCGVNLEYGSVSSNEDHGAGLWLLLSQSLERANLRNRKIKAFKNYSLLKTTIFSILSVILSIIIIQENWWSYQKEEIKISVTKGVLIDSKKSFFELHNFKERLQINISLFGISPNKKKVWEYTTTDGKNSSFPIDSISIVGTALNRAKNIATFLPFICRDNNLDSLRGFYYDGKERIEVPPSSIYTAHHEDFQKNNVSGLICQAKNDLAICIEFIYADEEAQTALLDSIGFRTTKVFLEEQLNWFDKTIGSIHSGGFAEPLEHY